MPTFEYHAQGADGQVTSGLIFGTSLDGATRELATKGVDVVRIGIATNINDPLSNPASAGPSRPAEQPRVQETANAGGPAIGNIVEGPPVHQRSYAATSVVGPIIGKVGLTHLAFFFRQFGTMQRAGVPMVQSLTTLARQSHSVKLRSIIEELRGHVEAGRPISAGLQRYPEVFTPVIVSLMRAGEEGGFVDDALIMIADYLDREIELRNLYKRITFYPKLQIGASIVIVIATNFIIASLGKEGGLKSPLTEISTWFVLTPIFVGLFLFFRVGLANPAVKHYWDMFMSNLPYLGKTLRQLAMAKFGRAFGALYKGGVAIPRALILSADACGNEFLRERMYHAEKRLQEGAPIAETFRQTNAFSPIVLDMVETGETTGNLDLMLTKMSEYYEDEASTRAVKLAQVTGVLLGLLVAIYIGYVVISFYTGYYGGMMKGLDE